MAAKHHSDLIFSRKQPGISIGRLFETCLVPLVSSGMIYFMRYCLQPLVSLFFFFCPLARQEKERPNPPPRS